MTASDAIISVEEVLTELYSHHVTKMDCMANACAIRNNMR